MSNLSDFDIKDNVIIDYQGNDTEVVIPDGITEIGDHAFFSTDICTVFVPKTVKKIGIEAFEECEKLEKVLFEEGDLFEICESAFYGCVNLQKINIPQSVKIIGESAFSRCNAITSVEIPKSIEEIGDYAFSWCRLLKEITVSKLDLDICNVFARCESLADPRGFAIVNNCLCGYYGSEQKVIIPHYIDTIGAYAFSGCKDIISILIPDSVKKIGTRAFGGCVGLADENGLVIIGNCIYDYLGAGVLSEHLSEFSTAKLDATLINKIISQKNVIVPDGIKEIDERAFVSSDIVTVSLPNGLEKIGFGAFCGCSHLKEVHFPDTVTLIDEYAFYGCEQLESISLPPKLKVIKHNSFSHCEKLKTVSIPYGVTDIEKMAFCFCSNLKSVDIPDSVQRILEDAFLYCDELELSDSIHDKIIAEHDDAQFGKESS